MATSLSEPRTDMVEVTSFLEVTEGLRAATKLAVVMDEESRPVRADTLLRIDGEAHTLRRRLLNKLVLRDEHRRLREEVLQPAVERELARIAAGVDADGIARADVVSFSVRVLVEQVAALIGLDGSPDEADALTRLQIELEEFPALKTQLKGAAPPPPEGSASVRRALTSLEIAKREFAERFYRPALAEHQRLIARLESGEIAEADLPNDFLTLVALHADSAFDVDADLPVREAIINLLHAGVGTSVGGVVQTLEELARWFAAHPEDLPLRTDPAFLARAVSETLRLHAANPAEVRRALEDLTLPGGTVVRAGQYVAFRTGIANRDASVFGPDADRFDPRRALPKGVAGHGVAFGAGPHMCYGVPLALGNTGADGNLVYLVRRLDEAGVRRDPDRPARFHSGIANADLRGFESYPVLLSLA